jgi:large subunit ribosomal protein L17
MRHLNSVNKLNRTAEHRGAMLANLAMSVLDKERVITTLAKAKAARGTIERLITFAKKGGLNSMRVAAKTVQDKDILKKLFSDIGPSYKTREGGYTRILKLGRRAGDDALTCILELTGRNSGETARMRKKRRKAAEKTPEAATPAKEAPALQEKPAAEAAEKKSEKPAAEPKAEKPKAAPKKKKKTEPKADDSAKDAK